MWFICENDVTFVQGLTEGDSLNKLAVIPQAQDSQTIM